MSQLISIISGIGYNKINFALYCQNKILKDFYTLFQNFVTGKIRRSKKDYYEQTHKETNNSDLLEKDGGTKNCIYKD